MISSKKHNYNRTEPPRVGEKVRVKSTDEIRKLLNPIDFFEYVWNGKPMRLAFTDNMWSFCGQEFNVRLVNHEKGTCLLANGPDFIDEWWFCNDMLEMVYDD